MKKNKIYYSIIIAILILAVTSAFFAYYKSISPREQFEDVETEIHKSVLPGDEEKIFKSINGEPTESVTVYPNISYDSVKELLLNIEMPESYCWYFKSLLFSSRKSMSENGILKFDGTSYKIEIYNDDNVLKKSVIEESGIVFVSVPSASHSTSAEFDSGSTNVFYEAGVPSVSDFLNLGGSEYSYSLIESQYGTLLFAEFNTAKNKYTQTEQYYISLDYGIVVRADCYENDTLVYSLETSALYEL